MLFIIGLIFGTLSFPIVYYAMRQLRLYNTGLTVTESQNEDQITDQLTIAVGYAGVARRATVRLRLASSFNSCNFGGSLGTGGIAAVATTNVDNHRLRSTTFSRSLLCMLADLSDCIDCYVNMAAVNHESIDQLVVTRTRLQGARLIKYRTIRLSYDNAKVTIDLRQTPNLRNILRRTRGFS